MNIIERIKNYFKCKLYVEKKRRLVEEEVDNIEESLEFERGELQGKNVSLQLELAKFKKDAVPEKDNINIPSWLDQQKSEFYNKRYGGAFSFSKFFTDHLRTGFGKKYFKAVSHNLKRDFGYFDDICVLTDGQLALMVKETFDDKQSYPLITGRTTKDLFTYYKGMPNSVGRGLIVVNLDENGNFVENILERDIPTMVYDSKGNIHFSEYDHEEFISQIVRKEEIINSLTSYIRTVEEIVRDVVGSKKLQQIRGDFNATRASSAEAALGKTIKNASEFTKHQQDLIEGITKKAMSLRISEDDADALEKVRTSLLGKIEKKLDKDALESVREDFVFITQFVAKLMGREPITLGEEEKKITLPKREPTRMEQKFEGKEK